MFSLRRRSNSVINTQGHDEAQRSTLLCSAMSEITDEDAVGLTAIRKRRKTL
jgi:hypothetical protein